MILAALPDTSALPGPSWLLTVLHLLTFVLHQAAMGTLLGGVVVVLAMRPTDRASRPAVRRLLSLFPVLMAATVTLGVAPLLFLQLSYGKVAYGASVTCASPWFLVPFTAMAAYAALYVAAKPGGARRTTTWLRLAILALLGVSLVYSATFSLAERPSAYERLYAGTASGWALNPDVATWGPRWIQAVAAAVAIGAFTASLVGRDDRDVRGTALRVLAVGAATSAAAGLARLVLDPELASDLGGPGLALYAGGALLPLAAVPLSFRRAAVPAGAALALGLVLSVVARHLARLGALSGRFDPAAPPIRAQWDVFAIFVVCLLVAVGVLAWMLRAWFRFPPAAEPSGRA